VLATHQPAAARALVPCVLLCTGALYYFALAHQADFDVRWCKGPIGSLIFDPLVQKLKNLGVKILPGRRVQEILPAGAQGAGFSPSAALNPAAAAAAFGKTLAGRVVAKGPQGVAETFDADAVVLAAGVPALQQMVRSSRLLGSAGEPDGGGGRAATTRTCFSTCVHCSQNELTSIQ
jgi:phytoene dehydrogenase-like protein